MKKSLRHLALAAVVALAVLATSGKAHAQRYPLVIPRLNPVNPNYYIPPGLTISQYAYNVALLGRAYSYVPPYALGYNPYPQFVNYGPVLPAYGYPAYNPYAYYNPYASYSLYSYSYNPYGYNATLRSSLYYNPFLFP